jgi:excisionase family DNA binding protein
MVTEMNYTDFTQIPLVFSVDDLAEFLGIGKNSAYDLVRCGRIKSIRVGHMIRIPKSALFDFLSAT